MIEREIRELVDELKSSDPAFRINALEQLYKEAKKGTNIGSAVSSLEKLLETDDLKILEKITFTIVIHYTNKKQDRKLRKLLRHRDEDVKWNASWFLTQQYIADKQTKMIRKLLMHGEEDVRFGALDGIKEAFEKGMDIRPAIPALKKASKSIYREKYLAEELRVKLEISLKNPLDEKEPLKWRPADKTKKMQNVKGEIKNVVNR